jgi:hypothetical protein
MIEDNNCTMMGIFGGNVIQNLVKSWVKKSSYYNYNFNINIKLMAFEVYQFIFDLFMIGISLGKQT